MCHDSRIVLAVIKSNSSCSECSVRGYRLASCSIFRRWPLDIYKELLEPKRLFITITIPVLLKKIQDFVQVFVSALQKGDYLELMHAGG